MRSSRLTLAAAAVSGVFLLSGIGITTASPGQKKKPAAKAASGPSKADIEAGKKVYIANSCKACHVIGEDKGGKTGPELTHVAKTRKPEWLSAQIRNPKKFDPKSTMPAYDKDKIDEKQLKSLTAYLSSLK